MPTQTFFRLPEGKRERLTEAAWKEFMSVRFADASINRIVHEAQIPRGSFYQYFEDKEDLFFYLLGLHREEAYALMDGALAGAGGDPFRSTLLLFDEVFREDGEIRASLRQIIDVLRLNQNMDMTRMLLDHMKPDPELQGLERRIGRDGFRRPDEDFFNEVAGLLAFSFGCAVHNILCCGAAVASEREKLLTRLEVLRRGSMKEETA